VEGPLSFVAVPESASGRDDVGPGIGPMIDLLTARLGREPTITAPDPASIRAALRGVPVVVSAECTVALATVPWLAEHHPDARVLWIDAHADFNSPQTSPSGYVGGMPLAGATGQWEAGVSPTFPAAQVVLAGVRDVDPGEQELLDRSGAVVLPTLHGVLDALGDAPVFVHLDPDVIDGYPCAFPPPPGGPGADDLTQLLAAVARDREVLGVTIASIGGPADVLALAVEPLLP
jgi:arginase family enzyme